MITALTCENLICMDLHATTKTDLFDEMATMLAREGILNDPAQFVRDVQAREDIDCTGFEQGVALPHARSASVIRPALAIGISRRGIEYGSEDGKPARLIFMIATPEQGATLHIELLAELSTRLLEPDFIPGMRAATDKATVLALLEGEPLPAPASLTTEAPTDILTASLSSATPGWRQWPAALKQHLLFGTSHMIPFIVAGGVLLSLSVMMGGKGAVPDSGLLKDVAAMGIAGLTLFTVVLGGYIAYSLADKPGLAPGMIGSWVAVQQYHTGFLGAILVGFLAGFIVRQLKRLRLPDAMKSLGAIFIYPLVGTFITCGLVMWVIGSPIAGMMDNMNAWLSGMAGSGKVMLGTILGGMTAFDMGGPVNKVATLFAQTQVGSQPWLMGGVGIAICVPPLGMALATFLSPRKYKREEREAGKAAVIMGMIGITEGAIPFAAADPVRVIPAIVAGGIVGNVTGFLMNSVNHAPWGGWIVLPVVEGKTGYIVGTLLGALTTAIIVNLLKRNVQEDTEVRKAIPLESGPSMASRTPGLGDADILAITACPSGVAHTFLAARSLEKAAALRGLRIKVETQGADGIANRLTPEDIARARYLILAHDVPVKELDRFTGLRVVEAKTRDAIHRPDALLQP